MWAIYCALLAAIHTYTSKNTYNLGNTLFVPVIQLPYPRYTLEIPHRDHEACH